MRGCDRDREDRHALRTVRPACGSSRTDVEVTRLGFGSAPMGGLFREVGDDEAARTVERAWTLGIRYFDVAPLYGYGTAERRLGGVLAGRPRDDFVVSTKVGRLVRPTDRIPPGADIDRQALARSARMRSTPGRSGRRMVFDYSADGVRAVARGESRAARARAGSTSVFIHDPDDHWQAGDRAAPIRRCTGSVSRVSSVPSASG